MEQTLKTEKERKEFKKNYIEEKLETHLINNYSKKNTKSEKRNQFYNFIDSHRSIQNLWWFYIILGNNCFKNALKQKFGKHDFSFQASGLYKCYVLQNNGTQFIHYGYTEIVLNDTNREEEKLLDAITDFDQFYLETVLEYIMNNKIVLLPELEKYMQEAMEIGAIDMQGQINLSYSIVKV